jgi:hypothetical protein
MAGPAGIDHQALGNVGGNRRTLIALHHRQSHVDAGGDAGGGPRSAVDHEQGVGVDPDAGEAPCELIACRPMGGDGLALQQADRGKYE